MQSKCSQVAEFHYPTTWFRSTRFRCFLQETLNNVTITFRTTNALSSAGFIAIQARSFSLKMKFLHVFSLQSSWYLLVTSWSSEVTAVYSACRLSSSMRSPSTLRFNMIQHVKPCEYRAGAIWLPHPHSLSSFIGGYSGRSAAHEMQIHSASKRMSMMKTCRSIEKPRRK